MLLLRNANVSGAEGERAHDGGFPELRPGLAGQPVGMSPAGLVAVGQHLGLGLREADARTILRHNDFDPDGFTPVHAFCDKILNAEETYVLRGKLDPSADPVLSAMLRRRH
mmetsp:Transcript_17533/g.44850  ORF Transcript_17533/g.44850 Transcript_17533/m.44850 type:complete len:111 (-) Transcript_17533:255-587(-)